jgi:hypothetical protein
MSSPPRVDPKRQLPLRLGAILLAYALYRVIGDEHRAAGIFIGLGTLILGYALVTYLTTRTDERSGLLQAGQTVLGLGLIGVGLFRLLV